MGRAKKKGAPSSGEFSLFDESDSVDVDAEDDLPRDEAGRAKIKHQYVDLLGIRVQKLAGRILNRERINKTLEGIYFVCVRCQKVCHNLDEGLVEDTENRANTCVPCSKQGGADSVRPAAVKKAAPARTEPAETEDDDDGEAAAPPRKAAPAKSAAAPKSAAKPPAKPSAKPAAKPAAKPSAKPAAKPAAKAAAKPSPATKKKK